jgi:hypothetical protein
MVAVKPALKKYLSVALIALTLLSLFLAWSSSKVGRALDGSINLADWLMAAGVGGKDAKMVGRFADILMRGIAPTNLAFVMKVAQTAFVWRLLYVMMLIATMVSLLHAALWHLMDRRYFGVAPVAGLVATLAIFISFNSAFNEGLGYGFAIEYRLTAWPFLALIFLLGSVALWAWYGMDAPFNAGPVSLQDLRVKNIARSVAAQGKSVGASVKSFMGSIDFPMGRTDWRCPGCGAEVDKKNNFCQKCGTPRPEPKKCSYCGGLLEEDAAFCGRCGQRYTPPRVCAGCGTMAKPDAVFCGRCGTKLD